VTNWFDPETPAIRTMLFCLMAVVLVMAAAIPDAFHKHALVFATAMSRCRWQDRLRARQPSRDNDLTPNFARMPACWCRHVCGLPALWPMTGSGFLYGNSGFGRIRVPDDRFAFPFWVNPAPPMDHRRRSPRRTCRLFVIVAFGETILTTGYALEQPSWSAPVLIAVAVAFSCVAAGGSTSHQQLRRQRVISRSDDPGRVGAKFHYVHVILIARDRKRVANDLVLANRLPK